MSTTPWVSLGEFKMRRGLKDPLGRHDSDSLWEKCILDACEFVERWSGRGRLLLTRWNERFDGENKSKLFLPHTPIRRVVEIDVGNSPITIGTAQDFWSGTIANAAYWTDNAIVRPYGWWPRGFANVRVKWESGWDTPGDVPEDVKSATIALAVLLSKEAERYGDQQKDLGGVSVQYVRNLEGTDKNALYSFRDWGQAMVARGIECSPPEYLS